MNLIRFIVVSFLWFVAFFRFADFYPYLGDFDCQIAFPLLVFVALLPITYIATKKVPLYFVVLLLAVGWGAIHYYSDIVLSDVRDGLKITNSFRPVVIVTGANSGIGYSSSLQFAEAGFDVILACRNQKKCEAAADQMLSRSSLITRERLYPMSLDVSDLAQVEKFVINFKKKFHRLDLLVNNAGFLPLDTSSTKQNIEGALGAMHIGHYALTLWLMDILQATTKLDRRYLVDGSNAPVVVLNIASEAFRLGSFDESIFVGNGEGDLRGEKTFGTPYHFVFGSYARSKLANVLFTIEFQKRVNESNAISKELQTYSVHPGMVHTNIAGSSRGSVPDFITSLILRSPETAGRLIVGACFPSLSKYHVPPGSYLNGIGGVVRSSYKFDNKLAERLWVVSRRLVEEWMDKNNVKWPKEAQYIL